MARSSMRCALLLTAALAILSVPSAVHLRAASDVFGQVLGNPDGGPGVIRLQQGMEARLGRLEQWLKAVMRHEPGTTDAAAERVGAWSNSELRALWIDTYVVVQLIRNPKASSFSVQQVGKSRPQPVLYTNVQLQRLRALACVAGGQMVVGNVEVPRCADILRKRSTSPQAVALNELDEELRELARRTSASKRHGDDNYILRRGALLHADVAMLLPTNSEPVVPSSAPGPQRLRMSLADGFGSDVRQVAVHWDLARMLLDYVKPRGSDHPAPGRDDMVRDWYRATAAWMQSREDYDTLHLDRAREIFPADPVILFLSGTQAETYAAPHIQSAIRSAAAPAAVAFAVGSDRAELRQAEGFFRHALTVDPALPELHLRFGHVLSLLERHADAARELRDALASEDEAVLRYYGQLFLGAAEEALGHADAAREAYSEAVTLYPSAQSPHIALSALARRRGDRATALREMQTVFELERAESEPDDPWWTYYTAQARNADGMLSALWRPFLAEAVP
jgi:tetratricopeptide (TPR) repeat protein